jgi:type II secretory pathway pseudopilin PulG
VKQRRAFTLLELVVVIGIVILLTGAAAPSFYNLTLSSRLQSDAAQLLQDLRTVRESAMLYQQDLRLYVQIAPTGGSTYYCETFLKDTSTNPGTHWSTNDVADGHKWIRRTLPSNMQFGSAPGQYSGTTSVDGAGRTFVYFQFSAGSGSTFRGQVTGMNSAATITIKDPTSGKMWYVILEATGTVRSSGSPPA